MAFLTGQSWRALKSWYSVGGPEQGFRRCFADGLNQSLVLSAAQATKNIDANASNRGRVCLFFQNDTKLVDLQIVQF